MPQAGRVGDIAWVPADSHGNDCCPHSAQGPAVQGSPNIKINGMQALRIGDPGVHSSCCGPNTWKAAKGAPGVFFNDIPAHRVGDTTTHCGGTGTLVVGSPNVIIGDLSGGTSSVGSLLAEPTIPYAGVFVFVYKGTDVPVDGCSYKITRADGSVIEGRTNSRGRSIALQSESAEEVTIEAYYDERTEA